MLYLFQDLSFRMIRLEVTYIMDHGFLKQNNKINNSFKKKQMFVANEQELSSKY